MKPKLSTRCHLHVSMRKLNDRMLKNPKYQKQTPRDTQEVPMTLTQVATLTFPITRYPVYSFPIHDP
jgi:hypothetical protein